MERKCPSSTEPWERGEVCWAEQAVELVCAPLQVGVCVCIQVENLQFCYTGLSPLQILAIK